MTLFALSKVGWAIAQPSNFLLFLLILGSALLIAGRRSAGTWLTTGATAALTTIGLMPVGLWLLSPLENRFPANPPLPSTVTGIIALGGGIDLEVSAARDQIALDAEAAQRLVTLVTLGAGIHGLGWPLPGARVSYSARGRSRRPSPSAPSLGWVPTSVV